MKKIFISCILAMVSCMAANAQVGTVEEDNNIFKHMSASIGVGVFQGIGVDVGTHVTDYVGIRAGFSWLPRFPMRANLDGKTVDDFDGKSDGDQTKTNKFEGKLNIINGKLLADIYPFPKETSFHVTAGMFIGSSHVLRVKNTENGALTGQSVIVGDEELFPDENGNVDARLGVWVVKPYIGLGIGRTIPKTHLGFNFDIGTMFWGNPYVIYEGKHYKRTSNDSDGNILKFVSKMIVCPVINFRISGRIL